MSGNPGHVWKLKKALYGFKRSPRDWNKALAATLSTLGFQPTKSDLNFYYAIKDGVKTYVAFHVDVNYG